MTEKISANPSAGHHGVDCAICICEGLNVLIPSALIAEVVPSSIMTDMGAEDDYVRGILKWGKQRVPVISCEQMMRGRRARFRGSTVVVVYATEDTKLLPYYALLLQSRPVDLEVGASTDILEEPEDSRMDAEHCLSHVRVNGISCVIPDTASIEDVLSGIAI